jgi:hypothetical protein
MEKINAINISSIGTNLEKIGDFLYHEGPLLSLFQDKNHLDIYYFYKWADSDDQCNRWLIFSVNTALLRSFLFQELSLRQLILKNPYVFLLDINNHLEQHQCLIASISDIPDSYLPKVSSYYKPETYTELANVFKNNLTKNGIQETLTHLVAEVEYIKKEQNKELSLIYQLLNSYGISPA